MTEQAGYALRTISEVQPRTLAALREHGVVFDRAPGPNPTWDDWQHVAFWLYTQLCEVDTIARSALVG